MLMMRPFQLSHFGSSVSWPLVSHLIKIKMKINLTNCLSHSFQFVNETTCEDGVENFLLYSTFSHFAIYPSQSIVGGSRKRVTYEKQQQNNNSKWYSAPERKNTFVPFSTVKRDHILIDSKHEILKLAILMLNRRFSFFHSLSIFWRRLFLI